MMSKRTTLAQQEEHLFQVLKSERFLNMQGLGNEVAHFIYDYDPAWALNVAQAKKRIKTKLDTERGIKVHRRDASGQVKIISPGMNDKLQPADIIYIKESLF